MVILEDLRRAVAIVERYADPDGAPLVGGDERPPLAGSMGMMLDLLTAPVDLVIDRP
jgi:hypothetical protein